MIYNLLAYPRSGSDLIRSYICAITGMTPLLPQGHYTLSSILEPYIIEQHNMFVRYHFVHEGPDSLSDPNSTLILLVRNPIENICAYLFADKHIADGINQVQFDYDYYKSFFQSVPISTWKLYSYEYFNNIKFFEEFRGHKFILLYEQIINNPNILYDYFSGRDIDFYKLSNELLKVKTSSTDPLKVSTSGKDLKFYQKFAPVEALDYISIMSKNHTVLSL